jgi:hypothetical protein
MATDKEIEAILAVVTPDNVALGHTWLKRKIKEAAEQARSDECTCGQSGHGNAHEPGCPQSNYKPAQRPEQVRGSEGWKLACLSG